MPRLTTLTGRFARDRRGATSIEYGVIAMLIGVGILAGVQALGSGNASSWGATAGKVAAAMKGGPKS